MDKKYIEGRKEIEQYFVEKNIVEDSGEEFTSPSGLFRLSISEYITREGAWTYSRGIVVELASGKVIADIKRNYSHFWHSWCQHSNGCEYLLCGEDYQGQTLVNLTKEKVIHYFPEAGYKGFGFCWVYAKSSPDTKYLAVEDCFWACPYEVVFFDFSEPDMLPYKEIGRIDCLEKIEGWKENMIFTLSRELEVRKSDGVLYEDLTDKERDELDNGKGLIEYKTLTVDVNIEELSNDA